MTSYEVSFEGLGITGIYVEPVAFQLFGVDIFWYSILMTVAVFLGLFLAMRKSKYFGIRPDDVIDTIIGIVVFMIIGARLFFVVFSWDLYKDNLMAVFSTRSGGLAFYGGVLGGLFGIWLVTKVKKIRFSRMVDFIAVYLPLGQAIGRWGNFFNQEAFGTNTTLPWGMYSEQTYRYLRMLGLPGVDPEKPVHPTFLYEFIGNMLIFAVLLRVRKKSKRPFEVTVWYLLLYGLLRFFVEGIRTDSLFIGDTSIRISQLLSGLMVLAAITILLVFRHKTRMRVLAPLYSIGKMSESEPASEPIPVTMTEEDETDTAEESAEEPVDEEDTVNPNP